MKEIQAYVLGSRVRAVVAALRGSKPWGNQAAGRRHNLTLYIVQSTLGLIEDVQAKGTDAGPQDATASEYKVELRCADEHVDEFVSLIAAAGRTGSPGAGWVYVTNVWHAQPIV